MIVKFKVQYLTIIEFLQEFMDANSPDANIFNENNQRETIRVLTRGILVRALVSYIWV